MDSLEKNDCKEIETALADFEEILVTDDLKAKGKDAIEKEKSQLEKIKNCLFNFLKIHFIL